MNPTSAPPGPIQGLIRELDQAVLAVEPAEICTRVKRALVEFCETGAGLDDSWLEPVQSGYGRRLLHRDPQDRYTVVVMAWGSGQGTPIHDHDGLWCVECVCRGRIRVLSYHAAEKDGEDRVRFEREAEIVAGVGEAGALIPPFDYHVIENPFGEPAATIHVYGGEMEQCCVFEQETGTNWHVRAEKSLRYTA